MKDIFSDKQPIRTITFRLPRDIFIKFKNDCTEKEIDMSVRLRNFIKSELEKSGKIESDIFTDEVIK